MNASLLTDSRQRCLDGYFKAQEIFILADGLSARIYDIASLDLSRTICVNHSYLLTSGKPAFLVLGDHAFMNERKDKTPISECANVILAAPTVPVQKASNVIRFRQRPEPVLTSSFSEGVYGPKSIGITAMACALLMGAALVNLIGFDYKVYTPEEAMEFFGISGEVHATGEAADHRNRPGHVKMKPKGDGSQETIYENRLAWFSPFAMHKNVFVNHNKHSALRMFPFAQGV